MLRTKNRELERTIEEIKFHGNRFFLFPFHSKGGKGKKFRCWAMKNGSCCLEFLGEIHHHKFTRNYLNIFFLFFSIENSKKYMHENVQQQNFMIVLVVCNIVFCSGTKTLKTVNKWIEFMIRKILKLLSSTI